MNSSDLLSETTTAARASAVRISEEAVVLELVDGRMVSAPIVWYPRLLAGSAAERERWEFIGDGEGVHWSDLDEDLSVESMLAGRPSAESPESFRRWLSTRAPHQAAV